MNHQNICPVYALENGGRFGYYLVMKWLDGITLKQSMNFQSKLSQKYLSPEKVIHLLFPIAKALDYAHKNNVIHRDVKPSNIFLTMKNKKVTDISLIDFGLAESLPEHMLDASQTLFNTSGTRRYMSPEQWRGRDQDDKTDQYSLGVVAYELLSGTPPFKNADNNLLKHAVINNLPEKIKNVSEDINQALLQALAKDPNNRYGNCVEFIEALAKAHLHKNEPVSKWLCLNKNGTCTEFGENDLEQRILNGLVPKGTSVKNNQMQNWLPIEKTDRFGKFYLNAGISEHKKYSRIVLALIIMAVCLSGGIFFAWHNNNMKYSMAVSEAKNLFAAEQYEEALTSINKALEYDDSNKQNIDFKKKINDKIKEKKAEMFFSEAESLLRGGMFDNALDSAKKASELNPANIKIQNLLKTIQSKLVEKDVAQLLTLANNDFVTGNVDNALSNAEKALNLDPDNREALRTVEKIKNQIGDMEEKQKRISYLVSEANRLEVNENYQEALNSAQQALRLLPNDVKIVSLVKMLTEKCVAELIKDAENLYKSEKYIEALEKTKSALTLAPNNPDAVNEKNKITNSINKKIEELKSEAESLYDEKKFDKAMTKISEALNLDPESSELQSLSKKIHCIKIFTVNGIDYCFRWCPPGEFVMGSPQNEDGHMPAERQHNVNIDSGFWIFEHEITVKMFRNFINETNYQVGKGESGYGGRGYDVKMKKFFPSIKYTWENPGFEQTEDHPVTEVDWPGAKKFCDWLTEKIGLKVDLPSEDQWEYACRANSETAYSFGNEREELAKYGNTADSSTLKEFPKISNNSMSTIASNDQFIYTAPVKSFKPNAWGIYDMHGNVMEWCKDGAIGNFKKKSTEGRYNRGGSWFSPPLECRSAYRSLDAQLRMTCVLGFRPVINESGKSNSVNDSSN